METEAILTEQRLTLVKVTVQKLMAQKAMVIHTIQTYIIRMEQIHKLVAMAQIQMEPNRMVKRQMELIQTVKRQMELVLMAELVQTNLVQILEMQKSQLLKGVNKRWEII